MLKTIYDVIVVIVTWIGIILKLTWPILLMWLAVLVLKMIGMQKRYNENANKYGGQQAREQRGQEWTRLVEKLRWGVAMELSAAIVGGCVLHFRSNPKH